MQTETLFRPCYANVRIVLDVGDRVVAEADAMVSMSPSVTMTCRLNGGLGGALMKRCFGGESIFVNEFSSVGGSGELVLGQPFPGDIECLTLAGQTLYLQPGAYIASEPGVQLGTGWAGLASFIGGEGLTRLKVSGHGRLWFGAYGAIFTRSVAGEYVVDTGHLVAYEPGLSLSVGMASSGAFSTLFSGEGLVTRVRGQGRIWMQTRGVAGLTAWTNRYL